MIYNGLLSEPVLSTVVKETVVRQNGTLINEEAAIYRVVRIQWRNLITNVDNGSNETTASGFKVSEKQCFCIYNIIDFIEEHYIHGILDEWTGR